MDHVIYTAMGERVMRWKTKRLFQITLPMCQLQALKRNCPQCVPFQ